MTAETIQLSKVGKTEKQERQSPNSRKYFEVRTREHLLPEEVEAMRSAIKKSKTRHAHRDSTLILLIYRHGLRVAEVASLRWEQIDFHCGTIYVKRVKKGTPSTHPLYSDEVRSLRKLQRDYPASPYVFQSSRRGSLALDTVGGIIERAGELDGLHLPLFMPICYDMERVTIWQIEVLTLGQFKVTWDITSAHSALHRTGICQVSRSLG
jgi:integrase